MNIFELGRRVIDEIGFCAVLVSSDDITFGYTSPDVVLSGEYISQRADTPHLASLVAGQAEGQQMTFCDQV